MSHMIVELSSHHDFNLVAALAHFRSHAGEEHVVSLNLSANCQTKDFKPNFPTFLPPAHVVEKPGPFIAWYLTSFHRALRQLKTISYLIIKRLVALVVPPLHFEAMR